MILEPSLANTIVIYLMNSNYHYVLTHLTEDQIMANAITKIDTCWVTFMSIFLKLTIVLALNENEIQPCDKQTNKFIDVQCHNINKNSFVTFLNPKTVFPILSSNEWIYSIYLHYIFHYIVTYAWMNYLVVIGDKSRLRIIISK